MSVDPHWLAWAAGIIDGEGCIYFNKQKTKAGKPSFTLKVEVVQLDPRMPRKLQELFGGNVKYKAKRQQPHWRPIYVWYLCSQRAADALADILPWLTVKKEQAEIAILSRRYVNRPGQSRPEFAGKLAEAATNLSELKHVTVADLQGKARLRAVGD